jgi:hypothetical protein
VRRLLDFWNTCAKHDSVFQKSPLLSPLGGDRLGKTRRFPNLRVPKDLEFAPHGVSSKIRPDSRTWLVTKVGTPTFVTNERLAHAERWPRRIIACLGAEDRIAEHLRRLTANGRRRHVFMCIIARAGA